MYLFLSSRELDFLCGLWLNMERQTRPSTDALIANLTPYLSTITDAAVLASYAGFLSVSSVTVFELAIKDIFENFATKKNIVFGHFVEKHLSRLNGRIKLDDLRSN